MTPKQARAIADFIHANGGKTVAEEDVRPLYRARDSGRHSQSRDATSAARAEGCQSGHEVASPNA